jgi:hypothetical protein
VSVENSGTLPSTLELVAFAQREALAVTTASACTLLQLLVWALAGRTQRAA